MGKICKRIMALSTTIMMAIGIMSLEASAYSEDFNLHYVNVGSVTNVTSFSKNVTVTSRNQKLYLNSFTRPSSSSASVTLFNHMSSTFKKTWSSSPKSYSGSVPVRALGTTVSIEAYLNNYSSTNYVYASGTFTG